MLIFGKIGVIHQFRLKVPLFQSLA